MKKMLGAVFALLALVGVTGCGSKGADIVCESKDGSDVSYYKATLDGDKVVKLSMESTTVAESEEEAELMVSYGKSLKTTYESEKGVSFDIQRNKLEVKMIMTYDFKKMDKDGIEDLLGETAITEADFREMAEGDGFTCK